MTPNNNGVTKDDIAELLGFTERQGSYYGDLLVYLGFYRKTILNIIQLNYLKNINKKLIEKKKYIILKSMVKHKSIKEYFCYSTLIFM